MQYALGMKDAATQPYTTSIPTATDAGTYYVWYKVEGDDNHRDSAADCVTANIAQRAVTVKAENQSVELNGTIGTGTDQVSVSSGSLAAGHSIAAVTLTASSTAAVTDSGTITPGDATIKDSSETDVTANYAITYASGVLTVTKIAPNVTPPAANTLTYNKEAQALVTAGSTTGGTMVYSTTENGEYSNTIPTGVNAGDYTVWYKVNGDSNYNDTEPASVTVTIGKARINPTLRLVTIQERTDKTAWTYGETDVVPYVEGNSGGGVVTMSYSDGAAAYTEMPADAGTYTARASVSATTNHPAGVAGRGGLHLRRLEQGRRRRKCTDQRDHRGQRTGRRLLHRVLGHGRKSGRGQL